MDQEERIGNRSSEDGTLPAAEALLLAQIRAGDADAGRRFVGAHYPTIYRYLLYLTGHREIAEDLTQETFFQAWRHLDGFQGRAPLRHWLHRIAHREFLRGLRGQRELVSLEELPDLPAPYEGAWAEAVELREVIRKLPLEEREVTLLHYLEGYSCEEIARIVRSPVGTVKYCLSVARSHLRDQLGEGDLAYMNEPDPLMRRWSWLPLEEMQALEARLAMGGVGCRVLGSPAARVPRSEPGLPNTQHRTPNTRSEATKEEPMERREFLRQAAVGAAGLMLPEAEKQIIDSRLTQKVTCAFKATALSDLCERVRADTAVSLTAGASVADEKVTLFCEKLPLREVMRQLSRPFGYAWLRSSKAGEYRYELAQDLRSQLMEEELRNRDRNEALLALDREMERFRLYLELSPEEAEKRAKSAPPEEKEMLERLASKGWGPFQMYFRLSPQEQAALRAGETLTFSADPQSGLPLLPPDVARGVLQTWRDWRVWKKDGRFEYNPAEETTEGQPPSEVPEVHAKVTLKLTQSELGQFTLAESGAGFTIGNGNSMISGLPLPSGVNPATRKAQNAAANAKLARDPSFRSMVTVHPEAHCGAAATARTDGALAAAPSPGSDPRSSGHEAKTTSADVLEALHRATGLSVVADYYTRLYAPAAVTIQNQPLFEALNRLSDAMRLRWRKDGNWLQFRSTTYYDDRLKEVSNRLLTRWAAARKQHGTLTLDDLTEIAQLPEAQLNGTDMAEGARECFGLAEWNLGRDGNLRQHLRFLATLTPDQRQAATTRAGLAFPKLTLAQQQQFISLGVGSSADSLQSLEELTTATLHVDYTLPGWFQWHAPEDRLGAGWPPLRPAVVRERTREAALQAALRLDPQATEAQVAATEADVRFIYTWGAPGKREVRWIRPQGIWGRALDRG
jgi:RNA polymerase sigma-70 factor (ECF subfamily)